MTTVNSISGGKTSAYIAVHYPADYNVFSLVCIDDIKCKPKDKSIIKYVNDKLENYVNMFGEFVATAEDDKTIIALMDLEQYLGKNIIWVRGNSYDEVINAGTKKRLPSWARRYCTKEMKLLPIFLWWFNNIGEKCNMRIGFRFDEFTRMENFFNNGNPTNFSIPVSTSLQGSNRQRHENYNWRFCSFPLIKDAITKKDIDKYWSENGYINNLFQQKKIEFPLISNCVGCFHKKPETLQIMWNTNEPKMQWFANQEKKGMGTWLDNKITYEQLASNKEFWIEEHFNENTCRNGECLE